MPMKRNLSALLVATLALAATNAGALPLTLPIVFENNQIYVAVGINGGAPSRFILDSGASGCVVDSGVAKQLGLAIHGEAQGTGAGSGTYTIQFVDGLSYSIGTDTLAVPRSYVIDLSGQRTLLGRPVAGILGYEFFARYVVSLDFETRTMQLSDSSGYSPQAGSDTIPFKLVRKTPHITAKLMIDTGAPVIHEYLVDSGSGDAITDAAIERAKDRVEIVSGVGLGREFRSVLGRASAFELGRTTLARPIVGAGGRPLIGNEILRRFDLTFDYARGRLILKANRHITEPFEFDASGLDLRWTDDLINFVVHDVARDSPAMEAGVLAGDIIAAIDARPVKTYTMEEALAVLRRAGDRVHLSLARSGKAIEVELHLRKRI